MLTTRSLRPVVAGVALALALAPLGACSDDDAASSSGGSTSSSVSTTGPGAAGDVTTSVADPTPPVEGAPDADGGVVPAPTSIPTSPTRPRDDTTSTTELLPAAAGLPPVLSKNSQGVDVALDETALLACAQNQIAWVAAQTGAADEVATALGIAAQRADASAVDAIKSSAGSLRDAASSSTPKAEIDRFLALCVANGFEY